MASERPWEGEDEDDWLDQPGAKQLLRRIQNDERERADAEMTLGEEHREEARVDADGQLISFDRWIRDYSSGRNLQASIDDSIATTIKELLQTEQNDFFDDLILSAAPRILRVQFPSIKKMLQWSDPLPDHKEVETLAIHCDPSLTEDNFDALHLFAQVVGSGSNIGHVELIDYPDPWLNRFVKWIKTREPSSTKDRIERWTWEQEDGTEFELRITKNV